MIDWRKDEGVERVDCDEVPQFLALLSTANDEWTWLPERSRTSWIFRGQGDSRWELLPSAWRQPRSPLLQRAHDLVAARIPPLTHVSQWDHTGSLPDPPTVDLSTARGVVVQANAEMSVISEFLHRVDELGIDVLGDLPPALHYDGTFEQWRPVAADDFLQIQGLSSQVALAQHYGVPTRLLDWTDDPLVAAFFAASSRAGDRLCVWALNEQVATKAAVPLWDGVGLSLQVIRPRRSTNEFLRAQRGAFTVPWGAGCYALVTSGRYPRVEDIAPSLASATGTHALRCVTLPSELGGELVSALERRWITRDSLMPSARTVVDSMWSRA